MIRHTPAAGLPPLTRCVIAVDPPASSHEGSNEAGVVACAIDANQQGYVLADQSAILAPREWAMRAIYLDRELKADTIVVEINQGGEMATQTIRAVDPNVPVKAVRAAKGKYVRAEPISAIYARGAVRHVEFFETLEDQMCTFTPDLDRKEGSPDRLDAMVWGFTELFPSLVSEIVLPKRREIVVR
jgi:phage terminase large subunit-like protein